MTLSGGGGKAGNRCDEKCRRSSGYGMSEYTASEKYYKDAHGSFDEYTTQMYGDEYLAYTDCSEQAAGHSKLHMSSRIPNM